MKAFVTGGSGFIGRCLIHKLIEHGYEVTALVPSQKSAANLDGLGIQLAYGDINDIESMREFMQDSDTVFHVAGYTEVSQPDLETFTASDAAGTRKVLTLAHELQVPRIIFTTTLAVVGDTGGGLVDESYAAAGDPFTEQAQTTWLAHYQIALPLIEKGAPIIIVVPGAVYGPHGDGLVTDLMRIFYRGYPIVVGADTVLTFAHVEDVAEGHILAAEKGQIGETYFLTGPAVSLGDMLDFWTYLTGRKAPGIRLPAALVQKLAPLLTVVGRLTALPTAFSRQGAKIAGATFSARSDKAREQLGWETRPLQSGMLETMQWVAASEQSREKQLQHRERQVGALAFLSAVTMFIAWLLSRRRDQ